MRSRSIRTSGVRRALRVLALLTLAVLVGADPGWARKKPKKSEPEHPPNPQDLLIVDCLLPGQIRRLGRQQTYVSRRRPVRTTALDCGIRGGEYVAYDRADYRTALRVWLETAEAGDAQAQYYVGEIYERGMGTAPDYAQAAEWYRKAADQGHAQAQINLGFLYEKGLGVPQDPRAALDWYRRATGVAGTIMLDSEIEAIQKELADAHQEIETAESTTATLQTELQETRAELDDARSRGERSTSRVADLERRVAELQDKIGTDQTQIAELRESVQRYDIAGPSIEIIDATAVRGASPAPAGSDRLVGRVDAPAGLAGLTADGIPQAVDDGGFFHFRPEARRITFVATDLQGKRAELVYDLDALGGKSPVPSKQPGKFGTYRALLIGNTDYRSMPKLETAASDVQALGDLLSGRYGFEVTVLQDASYVDILSAFSTLRDELDAKDNLVIYFAGHGELDPTTGRGYWLPVDADENDRTNWLASRELSLQLELLPARHVLVIADSCYSGALTRSALGRLETSDPTKDPRLDELLAKRSRTALTSGGLKPVLDTGGGGHSIFARSLLDALSRPGEPLEAYRLWSSVKAQVMFETRSLPEQQIPEYAPLQYAGHEGGEFFFVPVRG